MTMQIAQMPPVLGLGADEKWVYYTGKTINATDGSRSAISSDLAVGSFVTEDPYRHEAVADTSVGFDGAVTVTRTVTGQFAQPYGVVTRVPVSSRRGGWIVVKTQGYVNALVNGSVGVGDNLTQVNDQFHIAAATTLNTAGTHAGFVGTAMEANASGTNLRRIYLWRK